MWYFYNFGLINGDFLQQVMSSKRKRGFSSENVEENDEKPACKYGEKCYRTNPQHLQEFSHPEVSQSPQKKLKVNKATSSSCMQPRVPFLLTKVRSVVGKYNERSLAVSLKDILSSKMGDLQSSVQFNYMVDIPWLIAHYPQDKRTRPLLIVHGDQKEKKLALEEEAKPFPNVQLFQAKLPITFGTHHSKMMLLLYTEGMRVVITTANLIFDDWEEKTQGVWISPLFPKHNERENAKIRSSHFQNSLIEYLNHYGPGPLKQWKECILQHDMSKAGVHLVASVPGRHQGLAKDRWGHMKLRKLLHEHVKCDEDIKLWPVIGQFSSIGSLGANKDTWLCSEWLQTLATTCNGAKMADETILNLVFPTVENVRTSFEGYSAGGSLPYSWKTAAKQPYLTNFFCQWKSEKIGRTRASPHIKSYVRVSPDLTKAVWFLMTSANLSKAAWGAFEKNGSQLMIRSYEIGVLFLPESPESQFFNVDQQNLADTSAQLLTLPYDLPLLPYTDQDEPWLWDKRYNKRDVLGGVWKP